MVRSHLIRVMGRRTDAETWGESLREHFRPGVNRPLVFRLEPGYDRGIWERFVAYVVHSISAGLGSESHEFPYGKFGNFIATVSKDEIRVERVVEQPNVQTT